MVTEYQVPNTCPQYPVPSTKYHTLGTCRGCTKTRASKYQYKVPSTKVPCEKYLSIHSTKYKEPKHQVPKFQIPKYLSSSHKN